MSYVEYQPDQANYGHPTSTTTASTTAAPKKTTADRSTFTGVDNLGALLNQVPELRNLINTAVSQNWTADKFQNAVEESAWWKSHSDTARTAIIQQANDPAAYHQRWDTAAHTVASLAKQLGFGINGAIAQAIATSAILSGHETDQQWLTQQLSHHENYTHTTGTGGFTGQMAGTITQLQSMAGDYGITYTPAQLAQMAQAVVSGNTTIDTYKARMTTWARSAFPGLAQEIDHGATVKDLAQPYMQSMSNLLEVDPATLTTYTPAIRRAMQGVTDPKTGTRTSVPLWQFEDQVRQDPRWATTQNARDTVSSALVKLGADFGFGPQG